MSGMIARRMLHVALAISAAAAIIFTESSCGVVGGPKPAAYCAIMPDTIGLYVGNPVTQMGYPIGTITSVTPSATSVRVDFSVTERRALPHNVKAVIRSPSILADRALELVGNYSGGPRLEAGNCIPPDRSVSPKTLSEVIGAADTFLNSINPQGSANIGDTVRGLDQLARGNGAGANRLLTTTSALLDSPDQAISDIGSIIQNLAQLTTVLTEIRGPLKEILLDARITTPHVAKALDGTTRLGGPTGIGTLGPLTETVAVLETSLGAETQLTLDSVGAALRKLAPHANAIADLFDPVPWWINTAANHFNGRHFHSFNLAYRPPLYRIPTHDGLALCGAMNASVPGTCADVNGQPYAVDVALLQYVFTQASRQ